MENCERPRSIESLVKSPVQFVNTTERSVELFWFNHSGEKVSYGELSKRGSSMSVKFIDTFVTHPWIALDCQNKQRLWLNRRFLFRPPQPRTRETLNSQLLVKRANVFIRNPVFNAQSLVNLCLKSIQQTTNHEDIKKLPLPKYLLNDLKDLYH
ncbi:uncharacterized protein LOC124453464 [Xenia sp. Carnegie-2017]|uniref:uncharacterized protein LOC124453464 n=1 Tax=Xenia sp. Carnegie-2017 TaxID=2897299 RepID=UPI001F046EBC|nr:uncharacterized protein LOC124453464 [Xenia sp. Carnegie-2017]